MSFGKFVAVMPADPARPKRTNRNNRQLHRAAFADEPVENIKFVGMNRVFGGFFRVFNAAFRRGGDGYVAAVRGLVRLPLLAVAAYTVGWRKRDSRCSTYERS